MDAGGDVMQIDPGALSELKAAIADIIGKIGIQQGKLRTHSFMQAAKSVVRSLLSQNLVGLALGLSNQVINLHVLFFDGRNPVTGLFDKF